MEDETAAKSWRKGKNDTPTRPIRTPIDLWDTFGRQCQLVGASRSDVIRDFMRWYVREPKAKMPRRPAEGGHDATPDPSGDV